MEDYHVFSMDSIDSPCVDHGQVLHVKDVPWQNNKCGHLMLLLKIILIISISLQRTRMGFLESGVATSSSPAGPFKPQESYIPGSFSIDPAVFIDYDGRAYMYFGGLWGGQLEKWQTGGV